MSWWFWDEDVTKPSSTLEKLGIRQLNEFIDDWYNYLINVYIPKQGKEDMRRFVRCQFQPFPYFLWKATTMLDKFPCIDAAFKQAIEARFNEVFPDRRIGNENRDKAKDRV
jgi:hypothetical protein